MKSLYEAFYPDGFCIKQTVLYTVVIVGAVAAALHNIAS